MGELTRMGQVGPDTLCRWWTDMMLPTSAQSERELAEQPQERFAAQQLHALIEQLPAIVWTADTKHRFTSVMGSGLAPLGIEPNLVDLAMFEGLEAGDSAPIVLEAYNRALSGVRSTYSADWRDRSYECTIEPLYEGELIVGAIGVAIDLTDHRRIAHEVFGAYEEAITCIVRAIELRDTVTGAHVARIGDYCALLADAYGLDPRESHAIATASRLHDVGKIAVPDGILLKPDLLTIEERLIIRRHCVVGFEIFAKAQSPILRLAGEIALTHHEWFDGSGYPRGLAGEHIPLAGRVVAIADVFDALTSDRPYRPALTLDDARAVMLSERGTHFDPELLDLFLACGSLAQLFESRHSRRIRKRARDEHGDDVLAAASGVSTTATQPRSRIFAKLAELERREHVVSRRRRLLQRQVDRLYAARPLNQADAERLLELETLEGDVSGERRELHTLIDEVQRAVDARRPGGTISVGLAELADDGTLETLVPHADHIPRPIATGA
jgi:HD-GYP domain-containing protein (c-di-GMP phosphodiesterase class II)